MQNLILNLEKFFESEIIENNLSIEQVISLVQKRWGEKIASIKPSFFPEKGKKFKMNFFDSLEEQKKEYKKYLLSLKENQVWLPNAHGLVILENSSIFTRLIDLLNTEDFSILGLDDQKNLNKGITGYQIPVIRIINNKIKYDSFSFQMKRDPGEILFGFQLIN
jgi:hypothetical protein